MALPKLEGREPDPREARSRPRLTQAGDGPARNSVLSEQKRISASFASPPQIGSYPGAVKLVVLLGGAGACWAGLGITARLIWKLLLH